MDDEENVVLALSRQVRGLLDVQVCTDPRVAAESLAEEARRDGYGFAVVVSDMRMPVMDGAALLKHASEAAPYTTRVLLTGYTDVDCAIRAVNEGSVFRFLVKPCPTRQMHAALAAAVEQHQLMRDRRELLELTLRGAVEALVETLSMADPEAFARATRLRQLAAHAAETVGLADRWQVEVAAQLGEIGVITLPPVALMALNRGTPADPRVAKMLAELPELADGVLRRIPRMEAVREIVRGQQPVDRADPDQLARAPRAVRLVQAVREYDALIARGEEAATAVVLLRRRGYHDAAVLDALAGAVRAVEGGDQTREVAVPDLRPGMVLAADLRSSSGTLLVGRGQPVTGELVARIRNFETVTGLASLPVVLET